MGHGYRPATAEEIAEHWNVLYPKWTPEPGDRVIITQDHQDWCNKRGVIVGIHEGNSDYWSVGREDGTESVFRTDTQMILAPYEESAKPVEAPKPTSPESKHGFTIGDVVIPDCDNFKGRQCIVRAFGSASVGVHCPLGSGLGGHTLDGHCPDHTGRWYLPSQLKLVSKEEPEIVSKPSTPSTPTIPIPKEGYVTVRIFTEEEFKAKDRWSTFGSKEYPKGWNIEGYMNRYLGTYLQIPNGAFKYDNTDFKYAGWTFKDTDYEVIHASVKPEPEPKEPEMKAKRFKVGDKVTYRFRSDCKDNYYRWGGDDHGGYVGTIKSYDSYQPDYNCYGIKVTSREGEYTMLESEFYEYDGTYPGTVTLGTSTGSNLRVISSGTTDTPYIQTSGVLDYRPPVTKEDVLAKYNQAPVTLNKKPKTKLITVNTY
jgi:hypothetical protein